MWYVIRFLGAKDLIKANLSRFSFSNVNNNYSDTVLVPRKCLAAPPDELKVRPVDLIFVSKLVAEIKAHQFSLQNPLVAQVRGIRYA